MQVLAAAGAESAALFQTRELPFGSSKVRIDFVQTALNILELLL